VKKLTPANWLELDPTNRAFGPPPTPQDVVTVVLTPELSERVPEEIRDLFEVARAAMCYGCFFYPLWTLAAEQLFRVAEAAVRARCRTLRAGTGNLSFKQGLAFLAKHAPQDVEIIDWNAVRYLRNEASHPIRQTIITPAMAVSTLESTADALNKLFRSGP
jgi:hypothetical protein